MGRNIYLNLNFGNCKELIILERISTPQDSEKLKLFSNVEYLELSLIKENTKILEILSCINILPNLKKINFRWLSNLNDSDYCCLIENIHVNELTLRLNRTITMQLIFLAWNNPNLKKCILNYPDYSLRYKTSVIVDENRLFLVEIDQFIIPEFSQDEINLLKSKNMIISQKVFEKLKYLEEETYSSITQFFKHFQSLAVEEQVISSDYFDNMNNSNLPFKNQIKDEVLINKICYFNNEN